MPNYTSLCCFGLLTVLSAAPSVARAQVTPATASKGSPYVNHLGMKFVPVPITGIGTKKVLFSVWETRVQDFATYARKKGVPITTPNIKQGPTHPVVQVSWNDATAFCEWLTRKERASGKIGPRDLYRLPTDREWSFAVGIGSQELTNATPLQKSAVVPGFPWGATWPPPKGSGNLYDYESSDLDLINYRDGYKATSPVGSFTRSGTGLFDLCGNVWEWCKDSYDPPINTSRVLRGGSYLSGVPYGLQSSYRYSDNPAYKNDYYGFRCVLVVQGN